MLSLDLSQHLELCSERQTRGECCAPLSHEHVRRQQHVARTRRKGSSALRLNRVGANRGACDEIVTCVSFGRASSLAVVVFLLWHHLVPISYVAVTLGAAVSTLSMVNELREETRAVRKQLALLRETSEKLRLAANELRQAERDLMRISLRPRADKEQDDPWACASIGSNECCRFFGAKETPSPSAKTDCISEFFETNTIGTRKPQITYV